MSVHSSFEYYEEDGSNNDLLNIEDEVMYYQVNHTKYKGKPKTDLNVYIEKSRKNLKDNIEKLKEQNMQM